MTCLLVVLFPYYYSDSQWYYIIYMDIYNIVLGLYIFIHIIIYIYIYIFIHLLLTAQDHQEYIAHKNSIKPHNAYYYFHTQLIDFSCNIICENITVCARTDHQTTTQSSNLHLYWILQTNCYSSMLLHIYIVAIAVLTYKPKNRILGKYSIFSQTTTNCKARLLVVVLRRSTIASTSVHL